MPNENRSCKVFKQRTNINPDIFISGVPANCGNCQIWSGKQCINIDFVLSNQIVGRTMAAFLLW